MLEGGGGAKTHRQKWWEGAKERCMPNGGRHNCVKVCVCGERWGLEEEQVDSIELLEKEIRYPSESIQ